MATAKMTHTAAEFGMHHIQKKLEYPYQLQPSPTCNVPKSYNQFSHKVYHQLVTSDLPSCNCPCPLAMEQVGISNLFTKQTASQILMLLKYGSQLKQVTRSLLQIKAKHFQLEACDLFDIPLLLEACLMELWMENVPGREYPKFPQCA